MGESPTEWVHLCSPSSPVAWLFKNRLGDFYVQFPLIKINKYQWPSKSPLWFWELQQCSLTERDVDSVSLSWAQFFPWACLYIPYKSLRISLEQPPLFYSAAVTQNKYEVSWLYSRSYEIPHVRSKVNWPFHSQVDSADLLWCWWGLWKKSWLGESHALLTQAEHKELII